MKNVLILILFFSLLVGCVGTKSSIKKSTHKVFDTAFYKNQFTGFLVIDAQNNDTLFNFNGEKYFTPASNTKIVTLYSASELLMDSIPALKYVKQNDTLYMEGTGDPTFLHPYFKSNKALSFLKKHQNITLHLNNSIDTKYGPGWAWEDYAYYYQPEKGAFPLYGNVVTISRNEELRITPALFRDSVFQTSSIKNRNLESNHFYYGSWRNDTLEIPYRTSALLTKTLLENELNKKIQIVERMPDAKKETLFGVSSDTVYKHMLHESDNFLADQLLLVASSTLSDTLSSKTTIDYMLQNQLSSLRQQPRWVDGSGLSRYNLFTPESIVVILKKLYDKIPSQRLFDLFPTGGEGTLKNWYAGNPEPYLYAKTGSLGNVHNISGYLLTKSGKVLIFSFMNNHFRHPSSEVKKHMQQIFENFRDHY